MGATPAQSGDFDDPGAWARAFDWIAVVTSLVIPLIMFNASDVAGIVQRLMSLIGYAWYGAEALLFASTNNPPDLRG